MHKQLRLVAILATVVAFTSGTVQAQEPSAATAQLKDAAGTVVGQATLTTQTDGKVVIQLEVSGLTAGEHGIHIHAVGACTPDFSAAGPHFNPENKQHGPNNPNGPHAGDLPNLTADASGNAVYQGTTERVTLRSGTSSVFDADGSALVIHANADDYVTDPSGNSGGRVVCGVITAAQVDQTATPTGQPTAQPTEQPTAMPTAMPTTPPGNTPPSSLPDTSGEGASLALLLSAVVGLLLAGSWLVRRKYA